MSVSCKNCGSVSLVKNGIIHNKQRYKCKSCGKNTREGDARVRYTTAHKVKVVKMYLEGVGIRSIERLEGVSAPLIIVWIRQIAHLVKKQLEEVKIEENARNISILEVDELFTYCKKNSEKYTYGLLLIGTEIKLLALR
jgi:transposase-like protein